MKHKQLAHSQTNFYLGCQQRFESEVELQIHKCLRTHSAIDGRRLLTTDELEAIAKQLVESGIWG